MPDSTVPPEALLRATLAQKIAQFEQEIRTTSDPHKVQEAMEKLNQLMKLLSNLQAMQHDMTMSIIRNMK